jgi:hypothetical protein
VDREPIEPRHYRHLVVLFCERLEQRARDGKEPVSKDGDKLIRIIRETYRSVIRLLGREPAPAARVLPAIVDDPKEALCAALEAIKAQHQHLIDHVKKATTQRRQQVFGNSQRRVPRVEIPALAARLAQTANANERRHITEELAFAAHCWAENLYHVDMVKGLERITSTMDEIIRDFQAGRIRDRDAA